MKSILKIISVVIITAIYCLINLYSIEHDAASMFLNKNLDDKFPIYMPSESDISNFLMNSSFGKKISYGKILKTKVNSIEPVKKSGFVKQVKTYQTNNDIHFNFPLISYKFSLREYTEGS